MKCFPPIFLLICFLSFGASWAEGILRFGSVNGMGCEDSLLDKHPEIGSAIEDVLYLCDIDKKIIILFEYTFCEFGRTDNKKMIEVSEMLTRRLNAKHTELFNRYKEKCRGLRGDQSLAEAFLHHYFLDTGRMDEAEL